MKLADEKKSEKIIKENKFTILKEILSWEFDLYSKFMCADEDNYKKKKKRT